MKPLGMVLEWFLDGFGWILAWFCEGLATVLDGLEGGALLI